MRNLVAKIVFTWLLCCTYTMTMMGQQASDPLTIVYTVNGLQDYKPSSVENGEFMLLTSTTLRDGIVAANHDPGNYYVIQFAEELAGTITLVADLTALRGNVRIEADRRIRIERESCYRFEARYEKYKAPPIPLDGIVTFNEDILEGTVPETHFEVDGLIMESGLYVHDLDKVSITDCIIGGYASSWTFEDLDNKTAINWEQKNNAFSGTLGVNAAENQGPEDLLNDVVEEIVGAAAPPNEEEEDPCDRLYSDKDHMFITIKELYVFESIITDKQVYRGPGVGYNPATGLDVTEANFTASILFCNGTSLGGAWNFTDSYLFIAPTEPSRAGVSIITASSFTRVTFITNYIPDQYNMNVVSLITYSQQHTFDDIIYLYVPETVSATATYLNLFYVNQAAKTDYYNEELYIEYESEAGGDLPNLSAGEQVEVELYQSNERGEYLESMFNVTTSLIVVPSPVFSGYTNVLAAKLPFYGYYGDYVRAIVKHNGSTLYETKPYKLPLCNTPQNQQGYIKPELDRQQSWNVTSGVDFTRTTAQVPVLGTGADDYEVVIKITKAVYNNGMLKPDLEEEHEVTQTYTNLPSSGNINTSLLAGEITAGKYFITAGLHYGEPEYTFVWSSPVLVIIEQSTEAEEYVVPLDDYLSEFNQVHEGNINWEYTVNFYDNDRVGESMVFANGLGQVVQKQVKSDNEIIVTETAYGLEGASVINSLPTPVSTNKFAFQEYLFDVFDGDGIRRDFRTWYVDRKDPLNDDNIITPWQVDTITVGSTGHYYSDGGPEKGVGSANGYPYVYAITEQNPQGRILAQSSGVGKQHVASGKHANKNYYLHATQYEMYRLFGADAPDAKTVSKQISYDANNVGSLTYIDFEGNVLATGVLGDLANQSLVPFMPKTEGDGVNEGENGLGNFTNVINVLEEGVGTTNRDELYRDIVKNFYIEQESAEITVDYELTPRAFMFAYGEQNYCSNCNYQVELVINEALTGEEVYRLSKTVNPTEDLCTSPGSAHLVTSSEKVTLSGPAAYVVKRKISLIGSDGLPSLSNVWTDVYEQTNIDDSYDRFLVDEESYSSFYVIRKTNSTRGWSPTEDDIPDVNEIPGDLISLVGGGDNTHGIPLDVNLIGAKDVVYKVMYYDNYAPYVVKRFFVLGKDRIYGNTRHDENYVTTLLRDDRLEYAVDMESFDDDNLLIRFKNVGNNNQDIGMYNIITNTLTTPDTWVYTNTPADDVYANGFVYYSSSELEFFMKTKEVIPYQEGYIDIRTKWDDETTYNNIGESPTGNNNEDNARTSKVLRGPVDVAFDADSRAVFIADGGNKTIRKVVYTGAFGSDNYTMEMIAGAPGVFGGAVDGINEEVRFADMTSIAVLGDVIYVGDANTVRVLTPLYDGTGRYETSTMELPDEDNIGASQPFEVHVEVMNGKLFIVSHSGKYGGKRLVYTISDGQIILEDDGYDDGFIGEQQKIDYLDACDVVNATGDGLDDGNINGATTIVGLDGIVAGVNQETFDIDEISVVSGQDYIGAENTPNWAGYTDFLDTYELENQFRPELAHVKVFTVNQGNALLPLINDDQTLNLTDPGEPFTLVYIKFETPTCEELCFETATSDVIPAEICAEQKLMAKAAYYDATKAIQNSSSTITYDEQNTSYTLLEFITKYYPLSIYQQTLLESEDTDGGAPNIEGLYDLDLYQEYARARLAFESFNEQKCIEGVGMSQNNQGASACISCESIYQANVLKDLTTLKEQVTTFLNDWVAEGSTFVLPPALRTLDGWRTEEEGENDVLYDVIHTELIDAYGFELCNYVLSDWDNIAAEIVAYDADPTDEQNWYYNTWTDRIADNVRYACDGCEIARAASCAGDDNITHPQVDLAHIALRLESTFIGMAQKRANDYSDCVASGSLDFCGFVEQWWTNTNNSNYNELWLETDDDGNPVSKDDILDGYDASERCEVLKTWYKTGYIKKELIAQIGNIAGVTTMHIDEILADIIAQTADSETQAAFNSEVEQLIWGHVCALRCELGRLERYTTWQKNNSTDLTGPLKNAFIEDCLAGVEENVTLSYEDNSVHFTLYYYDKANRLIATVPPEGVDYTAVDVKAHRMETEYTYNSLGQLLSKSTPDGGKTQYIYDRAGRLRFSQSAEQASRSTANKLVFSYTKYDVNSRIITSGETSINFSETATWDAMEQFADRPNFPYDIMPKTDESITVYDETQHIAGNVPFTAENTAGRVAQVQNNNMKTFYSYDAHGRVKAILHQIAGLGSGSVNKWITYDYSPVDGRMEKVNYMPGAGAEDFYHKYSYDNLNRLSQVAISDNNQLWYTAAEYDYMAHGPLKKLTLASNLQQIDYAYTANGWLKAINQPVSPFDTENNQLDLFSEVLHYYKGDYGKNTFNQQALLRNSDTQIGAHTHNLYNGNIAGTTTNTQFSQTSSMSISGDMLLQAYRYDVLNRLSSSYTERYLTPSQSLLPSDGATSAEYSVNLTYDANGNITQLRRTAYQQDRFDNDPLSGGGVKLATWQVQQAMQMDDLEYSYFGEGTATPKNRLKRVTDLQPGIAYGGEFYSEGIDDYEYDANGRLKTDPDENLSISWTATDKVKSITKQTGKNIHFGYTPFQQRLYKQIEDSITYYYIYGAGSQLMAVYQKNEQSGALSQNEIPIYGAERLGIYSPSTYVSRTQVEVLDGLGEGVKKLLANSTAQVTGTVSNVINQVTQFSVEGLGAVETEVMTQALRTHVVENMIGQLDLMAVEISNHIETPAGYLQHYFETESTRWTTDQFSAPAIITHLNQALVNELNNNITDQVTTGNLSKRLMTSIVGKLATAGVHIDAQWFLYTQLYQDLNDSIVLWDASNLPPAIVQARLTAYSDYISASNTEVDMQTLVNNNYVNQIKNSAANAVLTGQLINWISTHATANTDDVRQELQNTLTQNISIKIAQQTALLNNNEWLTNSSELSNFIGEINLQPINAAVQNWVLSSYGSAALISREAVILADKISVQLTKDLGDISVASSPISKPKKLVFEINDHLGNVRATFYANNISEPATQTYTINSLTDYYPFGSIMPGRSFNSGDYRYGGAGGQEKDDEISGTGNSYTAQYWQYDPRLGRRWNVDPVTYPWQSSYATFNNNPVVFVDPLGLWGTRKEARQHKKDNNLSGRVRKRGSEYAIFDKKGHTVTWGGSGVPIMTSAYVETKGNAQGLSNYNNKNRNLRDRLVERGGTLARAILANEARGVYRNTYYSENSPFGLAFRKRWNAPIPELRETAQFWMNAAAVGVGGALGATLGVPTLLVGAETSLISGGIKTGLSAIAQWSINGRINYVGALSDGFLAPMSGSLFGSSIEVGYDFKTKNSYTSTLLGTKSADDVFRETMIGYGFGLKLNLFNGFQGGWLINAANPFGSYGLQKATKNEE